MLPRFPNLARGVLKMHVCPVQLFNRKAPRPRHRPLFSTRPEKFRGHLSEPLKRKDDARSGRPLNKGVPHSGFPQLPRGHIRVLGFKSRVCRSVCRSRRPVKSTGDQTQRGPAKYSFGERFSFSPVFSCFFQSGRRGPFAAFFHGFFKRPLS